MVRVNPHGQQPGRIAPGNALQLSQQRFVSTCQSNNLQVVLQRRESLRQRFDSADADAARHYQQRSPAWIKSNLESAVGASGCSGKLRHDGDAGDERLFRCNAPRGDAPSDFVVGGKVALHMRMDP